MDEQEKKEMRELAERNRQAQLDQEAAKRVAVGQEMMNRERLEAQFSNIVYGAIERASVEFRAMGVTASVERDTYLAIKGFDLLVTVPTAHGSTNGKIEMHLRNGKAALEFHNPNETGTRAENFDLNVLTVVGLEDLILKYVRELMS